MTNWPRERHSLRGRARELVERLPTKWLFTGVTGVVLALSALVGGLDDAPVPVPPTVEAGSSHAGTELTVTVEQVLLIDAFPELDLVPEAGNRLIVVRATVENTTAEPRRLGTVIADSVALSNIPGLSASEPPQSIAVIDDGSDDDTVVQPGVPVELAYIWEITADAVAAGDNIRVDLLDRVFVSEGRLTYGGLYDDPQVSATVQLALADVGAGANQ